MRRSIDPVGALMRWTFGSMDVADRVKLQKQLDNAERNDKVSFYMFKEQMTIISSAMQDITEPMNKLEAEHAMLMSEADTIGKRIANIDNHMNVLSVKTEIRTSVNTFIELITLKLEELAIIRSEEMQTIEVMINGNFRHNMVNLEFLKAKFDELTRDEENNYLDWLNRILPC